MRKPLIPYPTLRRCEIRNMTYPCHVYNISNTTSICQYPKAKKHDIIMSVVFMIKEYRKLANFTQKEMAEILKISERQYQRIDTEKSFPRKEILTQIFKILKIPEEKQKNYIFEMWKKEKGNNEKK